MQIRILNAEPVGYCDEARTLLRAIGDLDERSVSSRAELLSIIPQYDVLIVRLAFQIDREVIDAGVCLHVIASATTGLDHIDVEYAQSRGIVILSLKGETEFLRSIPAAAEHTWALLLALIRRISWAYQSVLDGEWNRDAFRGHDLEGKRLGIVGLGRIGERVARYGLAFEMDVGAYDPYKREAISSQVTRFDRLSKLLTKSDVVSLHVPLNAETLRMISHQEFSTMKPGALLVNTSRGAVIDEAALLQALSSGHLGGTALDVLCDENTLPSKESHPLIEYAKTHRNLLITPHLGGATCESMERTEVFMANKLKIFLSGG